MLTNALWQDDIISVVKIVDYDDDANLQLTAFSDILFADSEEAQHEVPCSCRASLRAMSMMRPHSCLSYF